MRCNVPANTPAVCVPYLSFFLGIVFAFRTLFLFYSIAIAIQPPIHRNRNLAKIFYVICIVQSSSCTSSP